MTVIVKRVGEPYLATVVEDDLISLQRAVGGSGDYIEIVPIDGTYVAACDADARFKGRPANTVLKTILGPVTIYGDLIVCRESGTGLIGVDPARIVHIIDRINFADLSS